MNGGLPYDTTPPPGDPPPPPDTAEPSLLDRPLSSYPLPAKEPIPEHVQSLLGRMNKGKVYLLEESPAIIHVDDGERIKGDARIAGLAAQLNVHDPTDWLEMVSRAASSPIRLSALWVGSELIQHLSTSKVFSWTTALGAGVMGIEWLNDTSLHLIFPTSAAALLGLSLLSKAGFDPSEGDDPLIERAAHSIPISLLPMAEPEPVESLEGTELLSGPTPSASDEVKRKGRGAFTSGRLGSGSGGMHDLEPLASGDGLGFELAEGVNPNARIAIRFALESDKGLRQQAKQSEWYRRHGRTAGKEVATTRRGRGGREEEAELSFEGRGGDEGRDFAKRIGRERREPYARPEGDRRKPRRTEEDLDKELEKMARSREVRNDSMDVDVEVVQDRRPARRERRGKDDLDRELEDMFAAREVGT